MGRCKYINIAMVIQRALVLNSIRMYMTIVDSRDYRFIIVHVGKMRSVHIPMLFMHLPTCINMFS